MLFIYIILNNLIKKQVNSINCVRFNFPLRISENKTTTH